MSNATVSIPAGLQEPLRWVTETLREIYGARLRRLILFGSQARGDARPDSDVDLLVVLGGPVRSYEESKRTSRVATRAAAYRGTTLSFVHLSEAAFAEDRHSLIPSVKEEGVDLLDTFSERGSSSPLSAESAPESESDSVSSLPDRSGR
jgi:predicted nucleotidyltransferase